MSRRQRLIREWERRNGSALDPEVFGREILSRLHGVSASHLAETTGLSRPYCSAILRGERVPHSRWWTTIQLASATDGVAR